MRFSSMLKLVSAALLLWASPIFGQGFPSGAAGTCNAGQVLSWQGGVAGKWVCVTPGVAFTHSLLGATHPDTHASVPIRGDIIVARTAFPAWERLPPGAQYSGLVMGVNEPAWAVLTLAGPQFVNQGTTTTLLHGNAAGNPSWSGVDLANDAVANQGTTTTLLHGNAAGQPSFSGVDLVNDAVANQGATTTLLHGNAAGQPSFAGVSLTADATVNQGTTTTLLHGNAAGAPSWGGVSLANDTAANQGTTTTVLHGNAAGQASFASVVDNDIDFTSFGNLTFGNNAAFTWTFNDDGGTSPTVAFAAGGVTLTAAGANQDITLTPSGAGYTLLNGNVGIGTVAPGTQLEISGAGAASGIRISSGAGLIHAGLGIRTANRAELVLHAIGVANASEIHFGFDARADGNVRWAISDRGGAAGNEKLFFYEGPFHTGAAWTPRLAILKGGSVGIGTILAASGQKLEVDGGVNLTTATARPACDAVVRGTFWVIQSAAGVKDDVSVCVKDALNAYAWFALY